MKSDRDEQFHSFVLSRRAGLVRTATLLTAGDAHLAEDLVQSTLTKLYVAWPAFQRADNIEGYLRRTLVNALTDERRRWWRRHERPVAELPDRPRAEPSSGGDLDDGLRAALRDLPPKMRAAVVFRYFYDLSVADTADALGCSEGTVKSQTARALDRLRAALDESSLTGVTR
ncbi:MULTISPECIES: SigE family RNA polymerase sigma factor [unclassified Micromonospora]|uniref:SigE family RNA polymerase sigma factor n=1 Tax=unclassified Micromonospora TaxID=2617518 RepID=UPI0022B7288F|nr:MULTISPECIES: SigE family RNA polymerase sigma factor [unclassified Micromonospora]MCZ7421351.1 SigE family RNA polymerase sigma factor [Verrucosispora sp. WMMA2121]WBB93955.1 SigE family RNA polymerase sigma factor [Verrucosispora sp. WMMC514]